MSWLNLFPASQIACLLEQGLFIRQALDRFAQDISQVSNGEIAKLFKGINAGAVQLAFDD